MVPRFLGWEDPQESPALCKNKTAKSRPPSEKTWGARTYRALISAPSTIAASHTPQPKPLVISYSATPLQSDALPELALSSRRGSSRPRHPLRLPRHRATRSARPARLCPGNGRTRSSVEWPCCASIAETNCSSLHRCHLPGRRSNLSREICCLSRNRDPEGELSPPSNRTCTQAKRRASDGPPLCFSIRGVLGVLAP